MGTVSPMRTTWPPQSPRSGVPSFDAVSVACEKLPRFRGRLAGALWVPFCHRWHTAHPRRSAPAGDPAKSARLAGQIPQSRSEARLPPTRFLGRRHDKGGVLRPPGDRFKIGFASLTKGVASVGAPRARSRSAQTSLVVQALHRIQARGTACRIPAKQHANKDADARGHKHGTQIHHRRNPCSLTHKGAARKARQA